MILFQLNYLAIVIAAIVYLGMAGLWYSPLAFGKSWAQENRFKPDELEDRSMLPALGYAFLAAIVLAFGLALLSKWAGVDNWFTGALMGLFISLMISVPAALPVYVFENRSMRLFTINEGMPVVAMVIMGAVIGGWK
ncbi:hypothetical protein JCM17844_03470 [Iodidimonas gelatinilytica]|uniref:DUF1761 domain-containing protein n=1 Tax=Iodidimonas gelatinilytica TaxID=1236966 RepID=A0A5A7ML86_9PROT|nr:DUF1761 domain-containing protein [Iodidimonas gelatinilytica]GEQ96710.1 hypothetical protein JCM17844_03470 [Iodidimonas gelatinilytica]GER01435.1 hypothetical protein JCM17845_20580 [Iodidimonas gelatinilytica]